MTWTGLKMAYFHGFEPPTPSRNAFLVWPWWILVSKAYIHYGPVLLCPDESLKHLYMASESLKKDLEGVQNHENLPFWGLFWAYSRIPEAIKMCFNLNSQGPWWILALEARIHPDPPKKSLPEGVQGSKPWKFSILRPVLGLLEASRGHKKVF